MPNKEDTEDASETRAGERQVEGARAGDFSTRVFAERWSVVAGLCLLAAAALLLFGRMDSAFVVATLGVVAWFWNERNRLRPRGIEADERFRDEDEGFEDRDEK
ncbi:MAG TPA: hypothetical protein VK388_16795 [Pyrinomonadaceae bacterium]|nr:hypothetical protein [Pyrinomonadaceae bacterium]